MRYFAYRLMQTLILMAWQLQVRQNTYVKLEKMHGECQVVGELLLSAYVHAMELQQQMVAVGAIPRHRLACAGVLPDSQLGGTLTSRPQQPDMFIIFIGVQADDVQQAFSLTGNAQGVALRLTDESQQPLTLGVHSGVKALNPADNSLLFYAQRLRQPKSLLEGLFSTLLAFRLEHL
ncbi:fimbrial protein [Serratia symbiotica]|uniref:Uncharacterized protein n=1 Tax=Serratia symbiotica TaxID=138074 RepID=A0A068ZBJ0_9GAMM|nr:hypothetical protein [Serratia symbiotica]QLH62465.1 hypothetical protein SYMBAF_05265 [Serratia symbiotica]CDS58462.1 putative predicted fimbrial-like adhesin protein [Serratia symbiotica]